MAKTFLAEDAQESSLRPKTLAEYIGQEKAKENLSIFIQAARKRQESLDHVLLHGPPGLGKTTLAGIIAQEMGVNIRITSGPAIEKPGDLAALLTNLNEGDILFVDEIHRLNRSVEEILYPAMEDYALDIIVGKGPSANSIRLDLPHFTLIGATTRAGQLSAPLRDRFGVTLRLELYTPEELSKIVTRSAGILNCDIVPEGAYEIARRSRGTPRIANRMLRRVRDFAQVKAGGVITKKVADRLSALFKEDRKKYEEKWDNLRLFIEYGMLSQEDFYDRAKDFALMKDTEGKHFTMEEYKTLIKDNQTDKDGNLVYLYANNVEEQYTYIEAAKNKGYSVLLMDGQLDTPMVSMLEQKLEKARFTRVDADTIDRLIVKEDRKETGMEADSSDNLAQVFRSQMPALEKVEFNVEVAALGETNQPTVITQSEYMRRMKAMGQFQPGMGFYAQMPDSYTLVLNSDHALIKKVLADTENSVGESLKPVMEQLKACQDKLADLNKEQSSKKPEEITQAEKDQTHEAEKALEEQREKKRTLLSDYAKGNQVVHQLIDLALLQNGMLKGAALDAFLKRSVDLIK